MMMVVANSILESRRRSGRLNAPDQTPGGEDAEGVVHRLQRDGADFCPHGLGHALGRNVRLTRHHPQDRQSLSRDLDPTFTKEIGGV